MYLRQPTHIAIISVLIILIATGCLEEPQTNEPPNGNLLFEYEYSYGEVTVLKDAVNARQFIWQAAVGYRDSLGDGNTEAIFLYSLSPKNVLFIKEPGIRSLDVVDCDYVQGTFVAVATGNTSSKTLYRVRVRDSVASSYHIAFEGEVVHPTGIVFAGAGRSIISGWVEDGGQEKAFAVAIDTIGNIRWSKYLSEPGMNARGVQIREDYEGYILACAYTPVVPGSNDSYSTLVLLDQQGTERKTVDIDVPGLNAVDFEFESDTGYCVVGTLAVGTGVKQTYLGVVSTNGAEKWRAPVADDSLYIPVAIKYNTTYFSIPLNINNNSTWWSIHRDSPGYWLHQYASNFRPGENYTAIDVDLRIGIRSIEYNAEGQLKNSVAFSRGR